jgi:hypothetical protein
MSIIEEKAREYGLTFDEYLRRLDIIQDRRSVHWDEMKRRHEVLIEASFGLDKLLYALSDAELPPVLAEARRKELDAQRAVEELRQRLVDIWEEVMRAESVP